VSIQSDKKGCSGEADEEMLCERIRLRHKEFRTKTTSAKQWVYYPANPEEVDARHWVGPDRKQSYFGALLEKGKMCSIGARFVTPDHPFSRAEDFYTSTDEDEMIEA
jgi:hypothetical protein